MKIEPPRNDEFTPSLKAAQVKRFLECLQGDPALRALLKPLNKTGAAAFLKSRGVDLDLDDLSVFFKDGFMEIPDKKNRSKNSVIKEWENAYRRERFRVDQLIDQMEDTLLPRSFKNSRGFLIVLIFFTYRFETLEIAFRYQFSYLLHY